MPLKSVLVSKAGPRSNITMVSGASPAVSGFFAILDMHVDQAAGAEELIRA